MSKRSPKFNPQQPSDSQNIAQDVGHNEGRMQGVNAGKNAYVTQGDNSSINIFHILHLSQGGYKSRTLYGILGVTILIVIAGVGSAWQQHQQVKEEKSMYSLLSQSITPQNAEIIVAKLPDYLMSADDRRQKGEGEKTIADYRQILTMANQLKQEITENPQSFPGIVSKTTQLEEISQRAESSLAEVIRQHRLPLLQTQLSNQDFGEQIENDASKKENQYTGALRTTYEILMGNWGVKADRNNSGVLDEGEEDAFPCETLKKIEELWRKFTNNNCGWYGSQDILAPECRELNGHTLRSVLMYPPALPELENRLEECKIFKIYLPKISRNH
ncbi:MULTISPECIES: hypothetical protein [unclassified Microcystis]|jgi:hypothetical protein|uniref:hypothetical protein n=1 Tax=unclassified Microcystis TaxID=2643300 RepID=UPI00258A8355|nr:MULTISPECIES: hypothetical protein [unclassified Microcystis]MCA2762650.1 hypothetical protein [Microcystis sp. M151S2]MCA2643550.1 hypothetical protein [Microcystis sp. M087S2]MCA2673030.1 hypothetical protein [Microcystis sp. M080S2]MCA2688882.1 hypothetical protein [Microcystis sp. M037S2]MCA2735950.1 hypothetical protein [Microcystis sp. M158S2]